LGESTPFGSSYAGGGVLPGGPSGLGVTVDEDVLGEPNMTWGD
jgi:hypothetical protein